MIVSHRHKVCMLLTPRCGSRSARAMFANSVHNIEFALPNKPPKIGVHLSWRVMKDLCEGIDDYRVFAFYRDPIEWFLSMEAYSKTVRRPEIVWKPNPQSEYINPPDKTVELLDYRRYDDELIRVAKEFGADVKREDIPRINEAQALRRSRTELTENELERIHEVYKLDFEFLKTRL